MTPPRAFASAVACGLVALAFVIGPARPAQADAPAAAPSEPSFEAPPEELSVEDLERYWSEAVEIELRAMSADDEGDDLSALAEELLRAAYYFERNAESPSGDPNGHWRAARATWLSGELLPLDDEDKKVKMARFVQAEALADRAVAANPRCGECVLWKFIAMGRVRTAEGAMGAARAVPEMAKLLDRALELKPTHNDGPNNSSMGNVHYSIAIFYRILPDWWFVKWVLGVRGDKERALRHARMALDLHPNRLDYRIELGTQLLCIGSDKKDRKRLAEGQRVMREAIAWAPETEDQRREIYFAKQLLAEPKKACGYTGDQIVEIDEKEAKKAGKK